MRTKLMLLEKPLVRVAELRVPCEGWIGRIDWWWGTEVGIVFFGSVIVSMGIGLRVAR